MITRPGRSPRPARPATCSSSWNVRSAGAKVGQVHRLVGRQHADQRDPGKVVPLGHHLRADQHVDLAARACGPAPRSSPGAVGGVAIEPRDARVREALAHHRLQPSRCRCPAVRCAAAGTTGSGRGPARCGRSSGTCSRARALVVRHRHRAAGTADDVPARAAQHDGREPAPVEEQDALLARGQRRPAAPPPAATTGRRRAGRAALQIDDARPSGSGRGVARPGSAQPRDSARGRRCGCSPATASPSPGSPPRRHAARARAPDRARDSARLPPA